MAKRGETRQAILDAAQKVFFRDGYEKTSVKMILEEANITTGSFYHFFPSKEALFEAVAERFLADYAERMKGIFGDSGTDARQMIGNALAELGRTAELYYNSLQGDNLHWTIRYALHERTLEAMIAPLAGALARMRERGEITCYLEEDDYTLAGILIRGTEAVIHSGGPGGSEKYQGEALVERLNAFWKCFISFEQKG